MTFNHRAYLQQFLTSPFTNDTVCKVERATTSPSYKLIGIHKLTPEENAGKHNLFIDCVDNVGNILRPRVFWGWEGQKPTEKVNPIALDKPASEPAGNISIWWGQKIWAQPDGVADKLLNVHTMLPDEAPGNTLGHHSYYAVWMWDVAPTVPPDDVDCEELQQQLVQLQAEYDTTVDVLSKIKELVSKF